MSNWSPKPRRPMGLDGLFSYEEAPVTLEKGQNRWQQQRNKDGSPHTRHGASSLSPPSAGPTLYLEGTLSKSYHDMVAVAGESFASEIYDYLNRFPRDSKCYKKAIKLLEEQLKLEHRQNNGSFKKNPEDYWKKCENLRIRKKELILEQSRSSLSKGLSPAEVMSYYLDNADAISKACKEKSLAVDEDDVDADELAKNK